MLHSKDNDAKCVLSNLTADLQKITDSITKQEVESDSVGAIME